MPRKPKPARLIQSDWPLAIARPFWLLTPAVPAGKRDRIFKAFATPEQRRAWLVANGYMPTDFAHYSDRAPYCHPNAEVYRNV
jgi:hypothetical protein